MLGAEKWKFPQAHDLSGIGDEHCGGDMVFVLNALQSVAAEDWIGVEARAAYRFAMASDPPTNAVDVDNHFWRPKCKALLIRVPVEPVAMLTAAGIERLEPKTLMHMASCLLGAPAILRSAPVCGRSLTANVAFQPHDGAQQVLDDVCNAIARHGVNDSTALFCFAKIIFGHPFTNGNGRTARMLLSIMLAKYVGCLAHHLPLAPIFYFRSESIAASLRDFVHSGKSTNLRRELLESFTTAAWLAHALLRLPPHPNNPFNR